MSFTSLNISDTVLRSESQQVVNPNPTYFKLLDTFSIRTNNVSQLSTDPQLRVVAIEKQVEDYLNLLSMSAEKGFGSLGSGSISSDAIASRFKTLINNPGKFTPLINNQSSENKYRVSSRTTQDSYNFARRTGQSSIGTASPFGLGVGQTRERPRPIADNPNSYASRFSRDSYTPSSRLSDISSKLEYPPMKQTFGNTGYTNKRGLSRSRNPQATGSTMSEPWP